MGLTGGASSRAWGAPPPHTPRSVRSVYFFRYWRLISFTYFISMGFNTKVQHLELIQSGSARSNFFYFSSWYVSFIYKCKIYMYDTALKHFKKVCSSIFLYIFFCYAVPKKCVNIFWFLWGAARAGARRVAGASRDPALLAASGSSSSSSGHTRFSQYEGQWGQINEGKKWSDLKFLNLKLSTTKFLVLRERGDCCVCLCWLRPMGTLYPSYNRI